MGLLKRLRQAPDILKEYNVVIQDQLSRGIVENVEPSYPTEAKQIHYIPHQPVIRSEKSMSKLRIVYDASAKATNGLSLNDCLYTGPKFGQNIMDILLRFRVHKVALSADIEKAYLMVSMAEEDRDVLRFLWVEDIHSHIPKVKTMRFSRVVFRVTSSPFLLNATVNHHMEKYRGRFMLTTLCSELKAMKVLMNCIRTLKFDF